MVCDICQTRNPAGFCISCQKMLCEECGKLCEECGKMICPECLNTTRKGRLLCSSCLEEIRVKKQKAKAGRAPEEGELAEEEFPIPEAIPRIQVRPWVASLVIGCIGIFLSLFFYMLDDAIHVSVFIVAVLGSAWGLVGIFGRSEQKGQAFAGLVLNLVPFIFALRVGVEAPWIKPQAKTAQQQVEEMSERAKFELRRQKRQEAIRRLRTRE